MLDTKTTEPLELARITADNELITKLDDGKNSRFHDICPQLFNATGRVRPNFMGDGAPQSAKGCQAWHTTIEPALTELRNR